MLPGVDNVHPLITYMNLVHWQTCELGVTLVFQNVVFWSCSVVSGF